MSSDVTQPLWLVVSQWVLLFALAALVVVMYRQLGYLLEIQKVGAEDEGLPLGALAPRFDYVLARQSTERASHFDPTGVTSLLLFADPNCVSCRDALSALESLAPKLQQTMRVLVVTSADPSLVSAVDPFKNSPLDIGCVDSDIPVRVYRTQVTPFAYVVDAEGKVRAKGITASEAAVREMVRKADRRAMPMVASRS